jgi:hypothetical protein
MSRLLPGGLALVISSRFDARNLGKCVVTERLLLPGEEVSTPIGPIHNWLSRPIWYCTGNIVIKFLSGREAHGHAAFLPQHLSPLNGDPDAELLALPDHSRRVLLVPSLPGEPRGMLPLSQ